MTFTIGRASFDNNPTALRQSGDRLDIDINILPDTLDEARVLRQQVLGLVGNDDEPVVPLTWSEDSDLDGFYRVLGADVEPVQTYLANKLMRARFSLERVGGGWARPSFELATTSAVRTNAHSVTTPTGLLFASPEVDDFQSYATTSGSTRASADGDIRCRFATPSSGVSVWRGSASSALKGRCRIEVLRDGSWYELVGRQMQSETQWRISNGLVRLTSGTLSSSGTLEWYDNSAGIWRSVLVGHWQSGAESHEIGGIRKNAPIFQVYPHASRNGFEIVTVQASVENSVFSYSLRRGAFHIDCGRSFASGVTGGLGVGMFGADTQAGSTVGLSGGVRTSAAISTRVPVFAIAAANTRDTTDTYVEANGNQSSHQGLIGVGSDGAGTNVSAAAVLDQWYAATSWTERVVSR